MDSFRRGSQFATSDLASKQAEFQKRFGLPFSKAIPEKDMFLDFPPKHMGYNGFMETGFSSKSPRLPKHNYHAEKPCVKVIPIEVENAEVPIRHQPNCVSDDVTNKENDNEFPHDTDNTSTLPKVKSQGPRVRNIPIQVEGHQNQRTNIPIQVEGQQNQKSNIPFIHKQEPEVPEVKKAKSTPQKPASKFNANAKKTCNVNQKQPTSSNCNKPSTEEGPKKLDFLVPMGQIQTVLKKLAQYEVEVNNFTGTSKDKQYRFLDEMLTRCMIELDDVDTVGNMDVRAFRKSAVKKIQACTDLLDSKICIVESAQNGTNVRSAPEEDMKDCAETKKSCVSMQSDCSSEIESVQEDLSGNYKNADENTKDPNDEVTTLDDQVEVISELIEPDAKEHPEETIKQNADTSIEDLQIDQTVPKTLVDSLQSTVENDIDSELDSFKEIATDSKPECDQGSEVIQSASNEATATEN